MSLMTDQEVPDKNQRTSEPVTKIKRERHGTRPHLIAAVVPALPGIIDFSDAMAQSYQVSQSGRTEALKSKKCA